MRDLKRKPEVQPPDLPGRSEIQKLTGQANTATSGGQASLCDVTGRKGVKSTCGMR